MFSEINDIDDLNESRAEAILNSEISLHNTINNAYQIRKKYLLKKLKESNCNHKKIKINTVISCKDSIDFGALYEDGLLKINIPEFAAAIEAGNQKLPLYPKDSNTFALYFIKDEPLPFFVIT